MASGVRAIIFDLDGTLYNSDGFANEIKRGAAAYIAGLKRITADAAATLIKETRDRLSREVGQEATLSLVCIELGGSITGFHETATPLIHPEAFLKPDVRVRSLLEELSQRFELYLYTNNNRTLTNRVLEALELSGLFETIFTIEDFWQPKPDRDVLEHIFSTIRRTPDECLFVGDRYDVDLKLPVEMGSICFPVSRVQDLLGLESFLSRYKNERQPSNVLYSKEKQMMTRTEKDTLGTLEVPADAYYGAQTARAIINFPISGLKPHPALVWATLTIKLSAALANMETGRLPHELGEAIVQAAKEALSGAFADQFVVDPFQAGAGTSHNMNTNEVLANRAEEILGGERGVYAKVHPNDHVNMAQSTNDVFPTAMRLSSLRMTEELLREMDGLKDSLRTKGSEFDGILKSGRTHLQDAVPIRLGQEFEAYAVAIEKNAANLRGSRENLYQLGLGGTAVGTGLNAEPRYIEQVVKIIRAETGFPVVSAANLVETTQNMDPFVVLSSTLKGTAINLTRIANDLRLLSSGPMTGLNEINLPPVQPGSSIMPGKVNPVILEMLNMVSFQVMGADTVITLAAQAGQMELNVMMPVIIHNILSSIEILKNAIRKLSESCIDGITANIAQCSRYLESSVGMATILAPRIGYAAAAEIVKESLRTGRSTKEIIISRELLSPEALAEIIDPYPLTTPGISGKRSTKQKEEVQ